jgi:hypothetical protein
MMTRFFAGVAAASMAAADWRANMEDSGINDAIQFTRD